MKFGKLAYAWFEKGLIKVTENYWGAHAPPPLPLPAPPPPPPPVPTAVTNAKMELDKVMNTTKSDVSEAYKAKFDCSEDSDSDSHDKNYLKEKLNDFVRLP